MAQSFSKEERLLKRPEFLRLAASGNKLHTAHFIIVWDATDGASLRLGITVSRKVGNAVVRNSIKRKVRENFRLHKENFFSADFNLIAKKGAEKLDFIAVWRELYSALLQIKTRIKC